MAKPKGSKNAPKKSAKAPKAAKREKFKAPVNTKTGAKGDAAAGKTEAAFVSTSRMTPSSFLKSLLTECRGFKSNADSIIGSMRERIAYGKATKNLNTGAFAWLRKIDKMVIDDKAKAAEWHATYMHYLETTGLMAKIEEGAAARLPLGDKPQVEGEELASSGEDDDAETELENEGATTTAAGDGIAPATNPVANNGIDPKPAANVTRPRFGQRAPSGISGDDLAKATGTDVKH